MNNDGAISINEAGPAMDALSASEMIAEIQGRLGKGKPRRISHQHVDVMRLMRQDLAPGLYEVSTIYKALLQTGRPMVMSQLYRVLRVLEEAGLLECHWANFAGRPRREFGVAGRVDLRHAHAAGEICKHCGAPLQHR